VKQVYLITHKDSNVISVFSSKWKAIAHFNRALREPDFGKWEHAECTVSVDGTTVGWITKKIVL